MTQTPQRTTTKGQKTRETILEKAVDLASVEGLEGLTVGRLAKEMQMSKSGLFGHFGSKEELQLATITKAREIFVTRVIQPAREDKEPGLLRVWHLCDLWLTYMEDEVFSGGCFYIAASAEFDGRPGAVRDTVANDMKVWLDYLEIQIQKAQALNQISAEVDPEQLAFEINAFYMGANWKLQLYNDTTAPNRSRLAILERLNAVATPEAPSLPASENYSN